MSRKVLSVLLILALVLSGVCAFAEADKTVIQFYFPVQLGGAAANMIEQFVGEFEQQNPDITVDAIFCGNYADTMTKLTLALEGNQAPQLCILDQRLLTLISMDAVVCLDDYIQADGGDELLNDFYPAYLESGIYEGAHYALPFQRSVLAMYYNKDHFTEVGLDPEAPPLREYATVPPCPIKITSSTRAELYAESIEASRSRVTSRITYPIGAPSESNTHLPTLSAMVLPLYAV